MDRSSSCSRLTVVEGAEAYFVAYADHPEDWVARFDKAWPEAREWAANMVELYNRRVASNGGISACP